MNLDHLQDSELLLLAAGEGTAKAAVHVACCRLCRARQADLHARLADLSTLLRTAPMALVDEPPRLNWRNTASAFATVSVLMAASWFALTHSNPGAKSPVAEYPNHALTPGAVRPLVTKASVCASEPEQSPAALSPARVMTVFRRYSIQRPAPRTFEVDYLIPPELGGSDDPRNLWPQPYAGGVWNARVKDALEDRLRAMVCSGEVDLAHAHEELSRDWIGAYKKLFRTNVPLEEHAGFLKDNPWE